MNPPTDIDDLRLQGSPNLSRALRREKEQGEKPPLSAEQKDEIRQLEELIRQAMKACARGQTVDGRRNPAFQNLADLVKTRRLVAQGRSAETKKNPAKGGVEALNEILDKMEKPN